MKPTVLKILLAVSVFFPAFASAQNSPPYIPKEQKNYAKFSPLADSLRPQRREPEYKTLKSFKNFQVSSRKKWRVRFHPRTGLPESLVFGETIRYSGDPPAAARLFIEENKELLGVDYSKLSLFLKRKMLGVVHLWYKQEENGLPVEFAYVKIHINKEGRVIGYQAKYEPEIELSPFPFIDGNSAENKVSADLGGSPSMSSSLVYYPDEFSGEVKLAWKTEARGGGKSGSWIYYTDANTGEILFKYDKIQYACVSPFNQATGTVKGMVYEISPIPKQSFTLGVDTPPFEPKTAKNLDKQYVWVGDYSSHTVVNNGEYCSQRAGKVFASLKGPYFSVVNFRGPSAHFDNGSGQWFSDPTSRSSDHPYEINREYTYNITLSDTWTSQGKGFAKAMPRFTSFEVGAIDACGNINDDDEVFLKGPDGKVKAAYIGRRDSSFFGAPIESPSYTVYLNSGESGVFNGFDIDISSYLVLSDTTTPSNATGSILWSTYTTQTTTDDEANAFYHLNEARSFFETINDNNINLDEQLTVMVNVFARDAVAGYCTDTNSMYNAFYDMENNNIMFGDGPMDENGRYHSFALDGTIVRHEYTHYVVGRIYPIINFGEFGAISEAIADYFSLTSFEADGANIDKMGNFIGSGEASTRNLAGGPPNGLKIMPDDWNGEVHDDSMMISQALWDLRKGANALGNSSVPLYNGIPRSDVFIFASLFYFPDTFQNFYETMITVCKQIEGSTCDQTMQDKITTAFSNHGIIGYFSGGDSYEPNNGAEEASDASTESSVSATVYPLADVDYYSINLKRGRFSASLALPETNDDGIYYSYGMVLFDSDREFIASAYPDPYNGYGGWCPTSGQCTTLTSNVDLSAEIESLGKYYLVVSASLNEYWGNSDTWSSSTYTLTLNFNPIGTADASIFSAAVDGDEISFEVPCTSFNMQSHPSSSTLSSAEFSFKYAMLLDHNKNPLSEARTDLPGGYLEEVAGTVQPDWGSGDTCQSGFITGRVKLKSGFSNRYPAAGTVYLQVFGINHLGNEASLGISGALHLTTNKNDATTYNNKILGGSGNSIIKYDLQSGGQMSVKIYTASGSLVKTVADSYVPAGKGTYEWDGTNSNGQKVSSGIYYVKINGPGVDKIEKVAVIR